MNVPALDIVMKCSRVAIPLYVDASHVYGCKHINDKGCRLPNDNHYGFKFCNLEGVRPSMHAHLAARIQVSKLA